MHMSRRSRVEEYACSIKFNNSMPRKTPSTANAVPLPQEGGLGDFTPKTPHPPRQARHLLPLEKATVRRYSDNRFFMRLLTEEWVILAFSCERRGTASAVDE